jgi:hypothetical protein
VSHFASTPAAEATCPRCHRPILTALDEGLRARVDPTPVTAAEEITALLAGRWTYTLLASGHLVHRDSHRITAGTLHGPTHAEHRCPPRPRQTSITDLIGATS